MKTPLDKDKKPAEKDAIAKLEEAAKKGKATTQQKTDAVKVVNDEPSTKKSEELQKRVDAALKLNAEKAVEEFEKLAANTDIKTTAVATAKTDANTALGLLDTADAALAARVTASDNLRKDYELVKAAAIADLTNTKLSKTEVLTELQTKVAAKVTNGSTAVVELVDAKETYAKEDTVKAKVTLTNGGKTMVEEITATFTK